MAVFEAYPRSNEHVHCACDNTVTLCNLRIVSDDFTMSEEQIVDCSTCRHLENDDFCPTGQCNG